MFLRQSTSQIIRFGPFLDSTDGVTPETGLTIAQADMQLSKDGGAFAQKNTAGNATHDTDGWYSTTLDATDTDTNSELIMQVNVSGALPVWVKYYVVPASTYDALTTNGLNNVAATDIVSSGAITTSSGAVSNVTTVATTTTNTDMRGTDNALLAASYTAPDNATIADTNTRVQSIQLDYSTFDPVTDQVTVATNNDKAGYSISGTITTLDGLNNFDPTIDQVIVQTNNDKTGYSITGTVTIDSASVDSIFAGGDIDGFNLEESQRVIIAASAGKLSGAATNNVVIRDTADTKDRIDANVDVDGNRTSVTLNVS